MKEINGTYKCGHVWKTILNGATKHEVKVILDRYKNSVCPKCADKESSAPVAPGAPATRPAI